MAKQKKEKKITNDEVKADLPNEESATESSAEEVKKVSPEDEALESRLLRLQADFDNYRKRTARERAEWELKGSEGLLFELLPVVDHFELGLNTARKHNTESSVIDGFQMVYDQFLAALKKSKVTPIPAEGELFDPHVHEAVTFISSEEHPAQTVIAETRRGYRLGDRLLRAAQVVVSSGPAETGEESVEDQEKEAN